MSEKLERVYRAFDPGPLSPDDAALYVDLDSVRGGADVVNRLATRIRLSGKKTCQLLAGHRGSGKSTELRRLQRSLEQGSKKIFVVFCESDLDIDRNDVDFPDVLIAIVRQLGSQLDQKLGISLQPGYFRDRWEALKKVLGTEVNFEGLKLQAGMLTLSAAMKSSPDAREEIRKLLEPDTGNWLHAANDVIGEAKLELRKKGFEDVVVIVDDLDKMVLRLHESAKCSTGEYLFIHREAQLSAFDCHMIYTIPLALAYSGQERTIANLYGGYVPVVQMAKITTRPPNSVRYEEGVKRFRDVIARRLRSVSATDSDVFASGEVRDELIMLSGGQPRELMILIREAIVGGGLPIQPDAVERVRREGRRAYARQLRQEHWEIIERHRRGEVVSRTIENDATFRDLLDSRALLQYANDDEWCGVNPLVGNPPPPSRS